VAEQVGNVPVEMKRMLVVKFAPAGCCEPPVHCDCDCWVADTVAAAGEEMVWWLCVRVLHNWHCTALKATGLLSCLQMKIVSFRMKLK